VRKGRGTRAPPRFSSFSLETDDEILGLGPKELAAKLVREFGLRGNGRKVSSPGNLAKARTVAWAKLTSEGTERQGEGCGAREV
jgi:hypothetical protein